jgi:hypothetical protein
MYSLTTKEFLHYTNISERTLRYKVKRGELKPVKKGRKLFFDFIQLPDDGAREAFLRDRGLLSEAKTGPKMPRDLKPWQKRIMIKRESLVKEYLGAEQDIPPGKKGDFQRHFAKMRDLSPQTLRRYIRGYKKGGREALAPAWNPGGAKRIITKEMEQFIGSKFLQPLGPTIAEVHEKLVAAFKGKCSRLPTYRTVADYINRKWSKGNQLLVRDKEEWNRLYSPYVSRDWGTEVNAVWIGDGKQVPVACLYKGKTIFPWFVAYLDAASRKFVGWILVPTHTAAASAQAFVYGAQRHGIPKVIYLDRGKSYKSRQIAGERIREEEISPLQDIESTRIVGIFGEMGIEIFWASPYNAREKIIEPAFKIFTYRLRGLPGYRGHNTKTRPKKLAYEIRAGKLLSFEELSKKIDEIIHARNARPHSTTGKTPNSYYENLTPAIPSRNLLAFLNLDVHKKKVRACAVTIEGLTYRHEDLFKLAGEEVELRRDPADIRQAAIIYREELFCIAQEVQVAHYRSPLTLENVKEARKIRRKIRQFRAEIIKQGGHIENPLDLAIYLNEQEQTTGPEPRSPKAKVVSLHKKERLAKKVAESLKEAPPETEAGGRGKITKLPREDTLEDKIRSGLFGIKTGETKQ